MSVSLLGVPKYGRNTWSVRAEPELSADTPCDAEHKLSSEEVSALTPIEAITGRVSQRTNQLPERASLFWASDLHLKDHASILNAFVQNDLSA